MSAATEARRPSIGDTGPIDAPRVRANSTFYVAPKPPVNAPPPFREGMLAFPRTRKGDESHYKAPHATKYRPSAVIGLIPFSESRDLYPFSSLSERKTSRQVTKPLRGVCVRNAWFIRRNILCVLAPWREILDERRNSKLSVLHARTLNRHRDFALAPAAHLP